MTQRSPSRKPWVGRALSLLGCAVALSAGPAGAAPRVPVPPARRGLDAPAPWSEASGSTPPPRSLVRAWASPSGGEAPTEPFAEGTEGRPAQARRAGSERTTKPSPHRHPAVHGGPVREPHGLEPLFPRAAGPATPPDEVTAARREARRRAMERHPSGKLKEQRIHVVRRGESLWAIAASVAPAGAGAIDRCVERIHAMNLDVIGPNADLIFPGQRLRLPEC